MEKTVGDIIKQLQNYPEDMKFVAMIRGTYSDYTDWHVVIALITLALLAPIIVVIKYLKWLKLK